MSIASAPDGYKPYDDGPLTETTGPQFERERKYDVLEPEPHQAEFLSYGETYHAIITGLGAGKTNALVQRIIANVFVWNVGYTGVVVTPTVPSLRNVLIPELRRWGYLELGDWQPSKNRWELPNGSVVIFESADNDRKIQRLRGPNLAWFAMDEPSTIPENAWDIMVGRIRTGNYINAFISGTPKGYNWVYDTFVDPEERLDSVNLVTGISSHDNPHTADIYKDSILEQYEGRFYEQEVLGKFTAFEGLVWPWLDESNLIEVLPRSYDEVIYGVDWGHNNPAVILAIVRWGDDWYVVDEWYETRCTSTDHARAAADMADMWGPGRFYCDPSEPANIREFRNHGLDARKARNDVTPGIQHVDSLRDKLYISKGCQALRNEFAQYQYKENDRRDEDEPLQQNDHACDSLRYATFTHKEQEPGEVSTTW